MERTAIVKAEGLLWLRVLEGEGGVPGGGWERTRYVAYKGERDAS